MRTLRVAILFEQYEPMHQTKDPGLLLAGLRTLGLDVSLVTIDKPSLASENANGIVKTTQESLRGSAFWIQHRFDYVIAYFWANRKYSEVARALKSCQIPFAIKLDSDGFISPSGFPIEHLRRAVSPPSVGSLIKTMAQIGLGYWLDRRIVEMYVMADRLIIESPVAARNLIQFLDGRGQHTMAQKIFVIPNPMAVHSRICDTKARMVALIGRWEDRRQKNTSAAIAVVRKLVQVDPRITVAVFGTGISSWKKALGEHPRVNLRGPIHHEELLQALTQIQVLFLPSNFESFSYAAGEALTEGATLAVAPFSAASYFTQNGRFGTVSTGFHPRQLLTAVTDELARWDRGLRDAQSIATYWTRELNVDRICRQYQALFDRSDGNDKREGESFNA